MDGSRAPQHHLSEDQKAGRERWIDTLLRRPSYASYESCESRAAQMGAFRVHLLFGRACFGWMEEGSGAAAHTGIGSGCRPITLATTVTCPPPVGASTATSAGCTATSAAEPAALESSEESSEEHSEESSEAAAHWSYGQVFNGQMTKLPRLVRDQRDTGPVLKTNMGSPPWRAEVYVLCDRRDGGVRMRFAVDGIWLDTPVRHASRLCEAVWGGVGLCGAVQGCVRLCKAV